MNGAAGRRGATALANRHLSIHVLVTGFQRANGERWARPVGVAIGPDGALYFASDSGTNGLFRLGMKYGNREH